VDEDKIEAHYRRGAQVKHSQKRKGKAKTAKKIQIA
jgi:hypothetical protein